MRVEVRPPSLCHAPDSFWQRLMVWLIAPAQESSPPLNRLPPVRAEFLACVADVEGAEASILGQRIGAACSLRDLWHLRTEVYRVVALGHSQALAEERLARLSRHFPTRAPRVAFSAP
ncbi:MAG: hypothetical protein KGL43_17565 [Burkholderiales bacterium]|nr:hypothetical protein [Burkholderiales bacterium]MDE2394537.1 hypothetical protein [Burkholderiales bacterium]MDE2455397.1 hypothetical protein [Burkholderiales bacterium]